MKQVVLIYNDEKEIIFQSNSEIEISTVYKIFWNYHYWNHDITIDVEEVIQNPKYKTVKSLYSDRKYAIFQLDELNKQGIQNNIIYPYSRDSKLVFISYNATIDSLNYHSYVKVKDWFSPSVDMIKTNIINGFKLLYPEDYDIL